MCFTLQYQRVDQRGPSLIILITSNTKGMYYFVKAYDKLNVLDIFWYDCEAILLWIYTVGVYDIF